MATAPQQTEKLFEQRILDVANKKIEKAYGAEVDARLQQGQDPKTILSELMTSIGKSAGQSAPTQQDVMGQVNQLASQRIDVPGTMQGPFTALGGLFKGEGYNPLSPHKQAFGMDNAIKIIGLQNSLEKQGIDIPKAQSELLKNLIDIAKSTGNKDMARQLGMNVPETAIEVDPMTGDPTAKGIQQKTEAETTAKKTAEINLVRDQFNKQLDNYLGFVSAVPTSGKGGAWERLLHTADLNLRSINQTDVVGNAFNQMKNMSGSLTPMMRRLSGDVGNATEWEQLTSQKLLVDGTESDQLREFKVATLRDFSEAVNSNEPSRVKSVLQKAMNNKMFKQEYGDFSQGPTKVVAQRAMKMGAVGWDSDKRVFVDADGNAVFTSKLEKIKAGK
jgi:hypothetical protein